MVRCALAALALAGGGTAQAAASVMIWPIDPVIESDQRAAALWLENRDTRPVTLQVRVLGWREESGGDVYTEDQNRVVGSPPMATVPPGKRQLIRLTRLAESAPGTEDAYRVLIDEIPQPDDNASQPGQTHLGVKFQMHYSIPLFVYGKGIWTKEDPDHKRDPLTIAQPFLSWHLACDGGKRCWLVMTNHGRVHARITQVLFDTAGERTDLARGLLGYVLPGAQIRWALPEDMKLASWPAAAPPKLIATVNGKTGVAIEPDGIDAPK
ncbi:molecular chaperone [Burkholderia sp. MSMB1078WGS]|nr:molecular chaperone [Burkholderia sp. MSMB1078WGS]KVT10575.1 molecular chaperone [Burkholderia sp. MSMB1078WGS]